jgi:hypothetical protein
MIEKVFDKKPLISVSARRFDCANLRAYLEEKLASTGGLQNFEFEEDVMETFTVPLGDSCAVCNAEIDSSQRHYWSFHK